MFLTEEQQKKAVTYSINWLEQRVEELTNLASECIKTDKGYTYLYIKKKLKACQLELDSFRKLL